MIVAFSLGLALVLMAIGLLMVYARGFMERLGGGRLWQTLPVFSPLIIAALGAGLQSKPGRCGYYSDTDYRCELRMGKVSIPLRFLSSVARIGSSGYEVENKTSHAHP